MTSFLIGLIREKCDDKIYDNILFINKGFTINKGIDKNTLKCLVHRFEMYPDFLMKEVGLCVDLNKEPKTKFNNKYLAKIKENTVHETRNIRF